MSSKIEILKNKIQELEQELFLENERIEAHNKTVMKNIDEYFENNNIYCILYLSYYYKCSKYTYCEIKECFTDKDLAEHKLAEYKLNDERYGRRDDEWDISYECITMPLKTGKLLGIKDLDKN